MSGWLSVCATILAIECGVLALLGLWLGSAVALALSVAMVILAERTNT